MKFFTIIYSILLSLTVIPIVIHSFISKLPPIQFIKTTLLQLKNNNQLDKTNSNTYINTNSNSNSNTNSKNNSNNYTYSNTRKKQICVLGGGFGGLYTALKINSLIDTKTTNIILVDPKDRFVFLPLLYELAVGTASSVEVAPRYNDLLKRTKINFVQGSVSTVNFDEKSFLVNKVNENNEAIIEQSTITFDELVIAVGIQPRVDIIPGASKHALPFSRIDDAYKLKYKLKELKESVRGFIRVAVIGGGYSGVEVAANIAQTLGINKAAVTIIDRNKKIMSTSPPHNRETSERYVTLLNM